MNICIKNIDAQLWPKQSPSPCLYYTVIRPHSHRRNKITFPYSLFKSESSSSGQSFNASPRLYSVVGVSILRFSSTAALSPLELPRQDRGDSTVKLCLFDGELEALHRLRLRFGVSKCLLAMDRLGLVLMPRRPYSSVRDLQGRYSRGPVAA